MNSVPMRKKKKKRPRELINKNGVPLFISGDKGLYLIYKMFKIM